MKFESMTQGIGIGYANHGTLKEKILGPIRVSRFFQSIDCSLQILDNRRHC